MKYCNPDIVEAIKKNKLVFFVGSGFSKDFDFPDWIHLVKIILEKLIEFDRGYSPYLDLLQNRKMSVLDILSQIEGEKFRVFDEIEKQFVFDESKRRLLSKHEKLLSVSKKIITTNYDSLLEEAGNRKIKKITYTFDMGVSKLPDLDEYIYKIHGDYEDSAHCIFFKSDYEKLYNQDNKALNEFKRIITDSTIIFIGFSLSDPYVSYLFKYITKLYENLKKPHYIVTTNENDFREYGIRTIKIDNWGQMDTLLDELLEIKDHGLLQQEYKEVDSFVDEDEFKKFIIEFHQTAKKEESVNVLTKTDLEDKFNNMLCSTTFRTG